MALCKKCGKKGLFLRIEGTTGMCRPCKEDFIRKSKVLTEKVTAAKNEAMLTEDPEKLIRLCKRIEFHGNELIALQLEYTLRPSLELDGLIEAYKRIRELLEKESKS